MLRSLFRILFWIFAGIGVLAVLAIGAGAVVVDRLAQHREALPERIALEIDLAGGVDDGRGDEPWRALGGVQPVVLREAVLALQHGAKDPRVAGAVAYLGGTPVDIAAAQELREAVAAFRAAGKPAWIYADGFGSLIDGTAEYYLASAFNRVWMQPSGLVGIGGVAIEAPFFGEALERIGIDPQVEQRREYKGLAETVTRSGYSDPVRHNLQRLADGWVDQVADGVAASRHLDPVQVRALIDGAPYLGAAARSAGLIDELGYPDAFETAADAAVGAGERLTVSDYLAGIHDEAPAQGPAVALIYGTGGIVMGDGEPLADGETFDARGVARAIDDAVADEDIAAILFRIDSPGGDYPAADLVWRSVQRAEEAGKPVIVSMGAYAASGGYFVAAPARRIVALPATVTGSIGVVGGTAATAELWAKLGVHWDSVSAGKHAMLGSMVQGFSEEGRARYAAVIDAIYADFTGKVAAGRGLDPAATEAAAGGRVWLGSDARAQGLVDEWGGLATAQDAVRDALGLAPDAPLDLRLWPDAESPLQRLFAALREGRIQDVISTFGGQAALPETVRTLMRLGRPVGLLELPRFRVAG
ncbi:MAG: S49 family peptidase [Alphaproteobacteria bacterium]